MFDIEVCVEERGQWKVSMSSVILEDIHKAALCGNRCFEDVGNGEFVVRDVDVFESLFGFTSTCPVVSVIGRDSVGKTWVLNELSGLRASCCDKRKHEGLGVKYPLVGANEEGEYVLRNLIFLEKGHYDPRRMVERIAKRLPEIALEFTDSSMGDRIKWEREMYLENEKRKKYILMKAKRQNKSINTYLENVQLYMGDVIVMVVKDLSCYDQQKLEELLCTVRIQQRARIYLIHNFQNATDDETLKRKIINDIDSCFYGSWSADDIHGTESFIDLDGVTHFVLANHDTFKSSNRRVFESIYESISLEWPEEGFLSRLLQTLNSDLGYKNLRYVYDSITQKLFIKSNSDIPISLGTPEDTIKTIDFIPKYNIDIISDDQCHVNVELPGYNADSLNEINILLESDNLLLQGERKLFYMLVDEIYVPYTEEMQYISEISRPTSQFSLFIDLKGLNVERIIDKSIQHGVLTLSLNRIF